MIYVNQTLEEWVGIFPSLIVDHGKCDACSSDFSTCVPFILHDRAGLISPECPCGNQTNDLISTYIFHNMPIEKWDEILRDGFIWEEDTLDEELEHILDDWFEFNNERIETLEEVSDEGLLVDMKGYQVFEVHDALEGVDYFYLARDRQDVSLYLITQFGERDAIDLIKNITQIPFLKLHKYPYYDLPNRKKYTFLRLVHDRLSDIDETISCEYLITIWGEDE